VRQARVADLPSSRPEASQIPSHLLCGTPAGSINRRFGWSRWGQFQAGLLFQNFQQLLLGSFRDTNVTFAAKSTHAQNQLAILVSVNFHRCAPFAPDVWCSRMLLKSLARECAAHELLQLLVSACLLGDGRTADGGRSKCNLIHPHSASVTTTENKNDERREGDHSMMLQVHLS